MSQIESNATVVVFGGSGFLGSRMVSAFLEAGYRVRIAARNPHRVPHPNAVSVVADIRDDFAVARALEGVQVVVNAVSLFQEKGRLTFKAIHVDGAARLAEQATRAGVQRLLHVSGIGVRDDSESAFVRARAEGERAVQTAFPAATIFRPSVMVDCDAGFLKVLADLCRSPVVPLFGQGDTRLQPAWAVDVANAAVAALAGDQFRSAVLELGGGKIYRYREALEVVAAAYGRRPRLIPVPFGVWRPLVAAMQYLPSPPLTKDQLILMQDDNVVGTEALGFSALGIEPRSLEQVVSDCQRQAAQR